MGEISLPSELMAAMNVFGGTDTSPLSAQDGTEGGTFGAVLGLLMTDTGDSMTVLQADAKADTAPEISAADVLSAAVKGETVTRLPDVFTEKGAAAFIKALAAFSEGNTDNAFSEAVWDGVSPEERTAFAELLYAAVGTFGDENVSTDTAPDKVIRLVADIVVRSVKKSADDSGKKADVTEDAALMAGLSGFIRPVQVIAYESASVPVVSDNDASNNGAITFADTADNYIADASPVNTAAVSENTADTEVSVPEGAQFVITGDISEKITELFPDKEQAADITAAFERLSDAAPEEIASFCERLADGLKGSVEVISPAPENTEAMHLDFGRQSVRGFMSRVNRHDDIISEDDMQMLIQDAPKAQAVQAADIVSERAVPESTVPEKAVIGNEDVDVQILDRIDLYRDIFSDNFSEKEISVKLSPDELGNVEVKIKRTDDGFEISFTAQKAEAAELIADKASELERAMASRGIALREMTVARQIVTNEADGGMNNDTFGGSLYGGAQNGQNSSERHFTFGGSDLSDTSDQDSNSSSDSEFNREAKLWVSA